MKLYGEPEQRQVPDMILSSGDTLLMHSSAPHHPPWPLCTEAAIVSLHADSICPLLQRVSLTEHYRLLKSKRTPSATYPMSAKSQRPQRSLCQAPYHGFRIMTMSSRKMTIALLLTGGSSLQLLPLSQNCQTLQVDEGALREKIS